MNRATGIHLSGRVIRLATVDGKTNGPRLCALVEAALPLPFVPQTILEPDTRQRLARGIEKALSGHDCPQQRPSPFDDLDL